MAKNQDNRHLTLRSIFYPSLKRKMDKAKFGLLGFIVIMAVVIAGCPMEINTNIGLDKSTIKGITAGDPGTVETPGPKIEVEVSVYVDVPGQDVPLDFNRLRVVNRSSSAITDVQIDHVSLLAQSGGSIPPGNSYQYRVEPKGTPPATPMLYQIDVPAPPHTISESVTMPPDQVLIVDDDSHAIVDGDTLFPELPGIDNTKAYLIIVNESHYPIVSVERSTTATAEWTGDYLANGTVAGSGGVKMWEVPTGAIRQYKINRDVGASGDPAQILYPATTPLTFTNVPQVIRVFDDGAPGGDPGSGGTNPLPEMASIVVFNMSSKTLDSIQLNAAAATAISLAPKIDGSKPAFYGTRVLVPGPYTVTVKSGASQVISIVGLVAEDHFYALFIGDDGSGGLTETTLDPGTIDNAPPPPITGGVGITTGGTPGDNEVTVTITTPPGGLLDDFDGYILWIGNEDGSYQDEKLISKDAVPPNRKVMFDDLADGTYGIAVSTIDTSGNFSKPYLIGVTVPWQSGTGGNDDPIWPVDPDDQPEQTNWTKIRVINQSGSTVNAVTYSRANNAGPWLLFQGSTTIAPGGQKVFSMIPATYAFKFTGRTPTEWPVTAAWPLVSNVEYIIILNDSEPPIIIDPTDPGDAGSLFVRATGSDATGTGTRTNPYATVPKALSKITGEKRTIVVLGTVYADGTITINGGNIPSSEANPITIRGEESGALKIATDNDLLNLSDNHGYVILGAGLTLELESPASTSLTVNVTNSTLDIRGADIKGNTTNAAYHSYGIMASDGAVVYLNSGTISGFYRGVHLQGYFYMRGGTISNNLDHGMMITAGNFDMTGGTIRDNETNLLGGGVFVAGGLFTMTGSTAEITGNKAPDGGGVSIGGAGIFTMNGGTISGNTAEYGGGGVSVGSSSDNAVFNMTGGTIKGNTSKGTSHGGGGVEVIQGVFSMSGGTIKENKSDRGAGVYVNFFSETIVPKFVMSGYTSRIELNKPFTDGVTDVPGVWIDLRTATPPHGQFVKSGGTITKDANQTIAVVAKFGSTVIRQRTATAGPDVYDYGSLNVDTTTNWIP